MTGDRRSRVFYGGGVGMREELGEYIEVVGLEADTVVVAVVVELFTPARIADTGDSFPMLTVELGVEMFVDQYARDAAVLAIASRHGHQHCRAAAGRIYQTLSARTAWTLVWASDDPDEVVLTRSADPAPEPLGC